MPVVAERYREELADAGINVIGVSQFRTSEAATVAFVEQHQLTFPNFYDPNADVATAYGINGVPSYIFLDKHGRIAHRSQGARGVDLIESVLTQLQAE